MNFLKKTLVYLAVGIAAFSLGFVLLDSVVMPFLTSQDETAVVPDLVGLDYDQAVQMCGELGLKIRKDGEKYDGIVARNLIINQTPLPRTSVKLNRQVSVIVSLGPEKINLPNVVGISLRQGKIVLERAGLFVSRIETVPNDTAQKNEIVDMSPPPNTSVHRDIEIVLTVSEGPTILSMPSLRSLRVDEAETIIRELGLTSSKPEYEYRPLYPDGTVLKQMPVPGLQVAKGDTVKLVISTSKQVEEQ